MMCYYLNVHFQGQSVSFREVSVVDLRLDNLMAFSITMSVQHQKIVRWLYTRTVSEGVMVSYLKAESRTHFISTGKLELIKLIKVVSSQLESVTRPFLS